MFYQKSLVNNKSSIPITTFGEPPASPIDTDEGQPRQCAATRPPEFGKPRNEKLSAVLFFRSSQCVHSADFRTQCHPSPTHLRASLGVRILFGTNNQKIEFASRCCSQTRKTRLSSSRDKLSFFFLSRVSFSSVLGWLPACHVPVVGCFRRNCPPRKRSSRGRVFFC